VRKEKMGKNEVTLKKIEAAELVVRPFHLLDQEWALLVGGRQKPNPMTVSWGGFGTLWNRPVATVYVRPTRHTFSHLKMDPEFTLNILPDSMRHALEFCGSRSGRDVNKWEATGLAPRPSESVQVPGVEGADLVLECRVIATFLVDPRRFLDPAIEEQYPLKDYHTALVGEVLTVWAGERFRKR
jgi:flavin reductase (DIM6/NTAB) family NADH-FMN oxidoreductase RutF